MIVMPNAKCSWFGCLGIYFPFESACFLKLGIMFGPGNHVHVFECKGILCDLKSFDIHNDQTQSTEKGVFMFTIKHEIHLHSSN